MHYSDKTSKWYTTARGRNIAHGSFGKKNKRKMPASHRTPEVMAKWRETYMKNYWQHQWDKSRYSSFNKKRDCITSGNT